MKIHKLLMPINIMCIMIQLHFSLGSTRVGQCITMSVGEQGQVEVGTSNCQAPPHNPHAKKKKKKSKIYKIFLKIFKIF